MEIKTFTEFKEQKMNESKLNEGSQPIKNFKKVLQEVKDFVENYTESEYIKNKGWLYIGDKYINIDWNEPYSISLSYGKVNPRVGYDRGATNPNYFEIVGGDEKYMMEELENWLDSL